MERDRRGRRQEEARLYTAYAKELANKFNAGYLSELTPYPQFTVWRAVKEENNEHKWKKLPYNPRTRGLASPTDPATWGTLDDALSALATGAYNGINFVFTETDPFLAIDLDHCAHDNRRIDYREEQLIRKLGSYSEYSARDGAHVIVKATLPITSRKYGNLPRIAQRDVICSTSA
jgi:primase-polymerase (primpol)-like protein